MDTQQNICMLLKRTHCRCEQFQVSHESSGSFFSGNGTLIWKVDLALVVTNSVIRDQPIGLSILVEKKR